MLAGTHGAVPKNDLWGLYQRSLELTRNGAVGTQGAAQRWNGAGTGPSQLASLQTIQRNLEQLADASRALSERATVGEKGTTDARGGFAGIGAASAATAAASAAAQQQRARRLLAVRGLDSDRLAQTHTTRTARANKRSRARAPFRCLRCGSPDGGWRGR